MRWPWLARSTRTRECFAGASKGSGGGGLCVGGAGGVGGPFPDPPPFRAHVTGTPDGLTGAIGGVLRYQNIHGSK